MATRADKGSGRKANSRAKSQASSETLSNPSITPESSPETLVADVVRTNLTRESVSSDIDRDRWIAERAYSLAERRGFAPGAELDDWLEAEREFNSQQSGGQTQTAPGDQFTG